MLSESNTMLPEISLRAQLEKLKSVSSEKKQEEIIKTTITRGWKSLDYEIDSKVNSKASFDTAAGSSNQFKDPKHDERYSKLKNKETF